jgi:hypothetical protein
MKNQPSTPDGLKSSDEQSTGISNRESAADEAAERAEHPPIDVSSPPPQDAAGRVGEQPLDDLRNRQTSHKTGSASIAKKEAESRYTERPMPATRKVDGAFGKEPQGIGTELGEDAGSDNEV